MYGLELGEIVSPQLAKPFRLTDIHIRYQPTLHLSIAPVKNVEALLLCSLLRLPSIRWPNKKSDDVQVVAVDQSGHRFAVYAIDAASS